MFEKSFITDCEGPLTLNDNAFELCAHFIEDGDELFKILSLYDDYLVDEVKKDNYKAGKLKAIGVCNCYPHVQSAVPAFSETLLCSEKLFS